MTPPTWIALLRGINVGGRNRVPMAGLRTVCGALGWGGARTYIQSGNVVFRADAPAGALEEALEHAVERAFGCSVPVIVRPAAALPGYLRGNPFPEASAREPDRVLLALSKDPPSPRAVESLQEQARDGERIARAGDALWIHYPGGAGRSRISPAVLDRRVGSPVTTRNWRTVLQLEAMTRSTA